MGDVGSLALGGALGALAVLTKNEVVSAIIHGVFLAESAHGDDPGRLVQDDRQARLQDGADAPPLRAKGLAEPKIIVRFWIVSISVAPWRCCRSSCADVDLGGRTVVGAGRAARAGSRPRLLLSRGRTGDRAGTSDRRSSSERTRWRARRGRPGWSPLGQVDLGRPDLVVVSPGVPLAPPESCSAARTRRPDLGRDRAGVRGSCPREPDPRRHRHQRQEHHHRADRRAARARPGPATPSSAATSGRRCREAVLAAAATDATWSSCPASSSRASTRCAVHGAAVLNLTPDHLDRYAGLEDYAAAKARIFVNQRAGRRARW